MEVNSKISTEKVNVPTETARLHKVLIHRPDEGIERVTPSRALDLLYEDIVYLPKMIEEHDVFTQALGLFTGSKNIVDFQDCLKDILKIAEVKKELIDQVCKLENVSPAQLRNIYPLDAKEAARLLISGSHGKTNLFNPLPNLIFTRDIGVVINDFLLTCIASKKARRRESLLTSFVFNHHPIFKELLASKKIIQLSEIDTSVNTDDSEPLSIEGGDIMMISEDHLIVATSERTTEAAIKSLINLLFERNAVKKITRVDLPKERYCMHLDTVFTRISRNECVGFEPLIMQDNKMPATLYTKDGKAEKFASIKAVLLTENPWMDFIPCGEGVAPFDEREQWTDGCNLVAVKEGVAFTYDRNIKTNDALRDHGYNIVKASQLIEEYKKGEIDPEKLERTIITIPSSELSRARGGPHCMTMPLVRS